jgi:short-subunit dehydrogenase
MSSTQFGGSVIVTGASGGIGEQFARQLAGLGSNLVLVARNQLALDTIADELRRAHPGIVVHTLAHDLSTPGAGSAVNAFVTERSLRISGLVNNAGVGSHGAFVTEDPGSLGRQIQLNCTTVVDLTREFLPAMLHRRSGMIINVASTAAFQPVPGMAVYGASKAFVLAFTEALWVETRTSGVRVLALCPGATETGFFRATGKEFLTTGRQSPETVVITALRALDGHGATVVSGRANQLSALGYRFMPRSVLARLSGRLLRAQT